MDGLTLTALTEQQKTELVQNLGEDKAGRLIELFEDGEVDVAGVSANDFSDFSKQEIAFISSIDPDFAAYLSEMGGAGDLDANRGADNTGGTGVNSDIGNIDELNAEIERLDAEITKAKADYETKNAQYEEAKAKLLSEQTELDELQKQYNEKASDYEDMQNEIEKATADLEEDVQNEQQQAIYKAMSEYNEEKDGPWAQYLEKELGKLSGANPQITSLIESLSGKSASLAVELGGLQNKIFNTKGLVEATQKTVSSLEGEVSALSQTIATNEATRSELSKKVMDAVLNSISPEEMALVTDNKITLSDKLNDGSPKYIFAKGKEDGLYHIYEMSEGGTSGTSLARTYGCNGGFDIIKSGNGYLNDLNKVEEGNGEKIYYMDNCDTVGSFNGCYTTCSPLSFDLNGDGVKTSNTVINYDIDGDGILDKINDSADGVLVFDKDGDGISGKDGSETFGDNTDIDGDGKKDGYKDGFEALKTFALNAGVINGADDMVIDTDDIKFLEENFGFKMKAGGYNSEAQSLLDLGITEINLASTDETTMNDNFDNQGNQLMTQFGATFKQNGETKDYADIWHQKKQ